MFIRAVLFLLLILLIFSPALYSQKTATSFSTSIHRLISGSNGKFTFNYRLKLPQRTDTITLRGICIFDKQSGAIFPKFNLFIDDRIRYIFDGTLVYAIDYKEKAGIIFDTKDRSIGLSPISGNMFSQILMNPIMDNIVAKEMLEDFILYDSRKESEPGRNMSVNKLRHVDGKAFIAFHLDMKTLLPKKISKIVDPDIDTQFEEWSFSDIELSNYDSLKLFTYDSSGGKVTLAQYQRRAKEQLKTDMDAPLINQQSVNGKHFSFDEFPENLFVLDFWYSSCYPCIKSFPFLNKISDMFDGKVKVVGINAVDKKIATIKESIKKYELAYPILMDSTNLVNRYFVSSYPTIVIVGRDLKVKYVKIGYSDNLMEELIEKINSLL